MPPRKKARLSTATSPEPDTDRKTPTPSPNVHTTQSADDEALLNDPWTDEEEIALFKGLMRWKPTGIHKHFRLMQLHAWAIENAYFHPSCEHTRPNGIWSKLETMYDLPALDAREDARQLPKLSNPLVTGDEDATMKDAEREKAVDDADVYSEAENRIEEEDFTLPPDADDEDGYGFEEEMWKRRLPNKPEEADEDGESEAELAEVNLAEEPPVRFMPSFSIEPSEAATPGSRKGRSGQKKGSVSEAKPGASKAGTRRSARQAESVADEEEEREEENNEGGEGDEEGEEGEGEESEEASQASTPAPRSTRAAKGSRGKTAAKGKGRTRKR